MALTDEFRNTPYYDDFNEDKNFHRLFLDLVGQFNAVN